MTLKIFKSIHLVFYLLIMASCDSEPQVPQAALGTFEFAFEQITFGKNARATLYSLDANQLVITITKSDGTATDYTQKKLGLYLSGESLVSEKIALPAGDYLISMLYLMNKDNAVQWAIPQKDLALAQKITISLPFPFSLTNQNPSLGPITIKMEVLPTEGWKPEDFGLDASIISFKKIFNVFIALVEKVGDMKFLSGRITVSSDVYTYEQELKEEINKINFSSAYGSYKIKIESEGYHPYEKVFSRDSLKAHESTPILVALEKSECIGGTYVGDVFLSTRMDAINFGKKCYTQIEGSLRMGLYPTDYITDLSPLSSLESITGHLEIKSNLALTSLKGLDNLKSIGGDVQIDDNPQLSNITLNNLTHIGRSLRIKNNESLKNLNSMEKLSSVGNIFNEDKGYHISITNNKSLENYCGLNYLFTKGTYYRTDINSNLYNFGEKEMAEGNCSI